MRRVVFQCVSAFGVLLAAAVLDLGPSARAAYIPVSGICDSHGLGSGPADEPPTNPTDPNLDREPTPAGHLQGGGGMAPSGGNSSSSSTPVAGVLSRSELPADGLVVYFRAPTGSLQLSAFIDSILDPPRRA